MSVLVQKFEQAIRSQDFLTMEPPFTQVCGSRVLPMAWGGSYWHHDIRDKEAHRPTMSHLM